MSRLVTERQGSCSLLLHCSNVFHQRMTDFPLGAVGLWATAQSEKKKPNTEQENKSELSQRPHTFLESHQAVGCQGEESVRGGSAYFFKGIADFHVYDEMFLLTISQPSIT